MILRNGLDTSEAKRGRSKPQGDEDETSESGESPAINKNIVYSDE